ncbi:HAMP domain-containing sensor histidine kinase [Dactylosporangium sp. NPDC049525]|uniref:sensor histidine kinase n=1 Tax=Dactylosporangium sp. NPDC049525 TaxID=3154730 RepID=UPI003422A51B
MKVPAHRSLVVRLLATSTVIVICAIAATAWLTVRITTRDVVQEPGRTLSADTDVYDAFIAHAATHPTWDGAADTVRRLASLTGRRIALATQDRQVIADSSPGVPLEHVRPSALVDPLHLDAALARNSGGRIDARVVGPYRISAGEREYLRLIAGSEVQCFREARVAAEVVETPSGRPTVRLLSADDSTGCRPSKLELPVESEKVPLAQLGRQVSECAGIPVSVTPTFALRFTGPAETPLRCLEDSRRDQLRPYVAPPALLFITGPPRLADPPTVSLSRANTTQVVAMTLVVLAVACTATVLAGRRLVRPLRLLTAAASSPADQHGRVDVGSRDEIGHLADAFNDLAERRSQLERQRKAMVNDVAHELRTPLTNIRTWLEAVRDGVTAPDAAVLDLLVEESVLLQHIIDDLRDLAAADAGNLRVHPEPTYVEDILNQVVEAHRGAADAGGVTCVLDAVGDPVLRVDPVRLRQLVGNLLTNAIRHTPPGGTVTVRSRLTAGALTVDVTDDGAGIAPADLPRVFDRFWRADGSRSRTTGGSGLGLPIARQLARAHGGDVTVTSTPGEGSTFAVRLPRSP